MPTSTEAIKQELIDNGLDRVISSVGSSAINSTVIHETLHPGRVSEGYMDIVLPNWREEAEEYPDDQKLLEAYAYADDSIEKLQHLANMSLASAVRAVARSGIDRAEGYLGGRLQTYASMLQDAPRPVKPEDIEQGLWRDVVYASMIGTPELAIYKIAEDTCQSKGSSIMH